MGGVARSYVPVPVMLVDISTSKASREFVLIVIYGTT